MARLTDLHSEIADCEACPRLRKYCLHVAQEKKRAYAGETYWGKPIHGFGDPKARIMIVGLAPAAHGANRTGRIFTGDRSGDWLFRALHKAGFANQPHSHDLRDGLKLRDVYISCVVRCAPPDNRPTPKELVTCLPYLEREIALLKNVQVFIALGQIALAGVWPLISASEESQNPRPKFAHANTVTLPDGRSLILSYHPSQQNTFTGRLTEPMFDQVFSLARELLNGFGDHGIFKELAPAFRINLRGHDN